MSSSACWSSVPAGVSNDRPLEAKEPPVRESGAGRRRAGSLPMPCERGSVSPWAELTAAGRWPGSGRTGPGAASAPPRSSTNAAPAGRAGGGSSPRATAGAWTPSRRSDRRGQALRPTRARHVVRPIASTGRGERRPRAARDPGGLRRHGACSSRQHRVRRGSRRFARSAQGRPGEDRAQGPRQQTRSRRPPRPRSCREAFYPWRDIPTCVSINAGRITRVRPCGIQAGKSALER